MSKIVTIFGGSGFLGRYIARRLARQGWRIRVAVRHPNEAMHVKPYGAVGQVEPVLCNIRNDTSVRDMMQGADAVVNCVGTFDISGKNSFDAVQHEGAGRVARIAAEMGVSRLVHVSAIGADKNSKSEYSRSKALGEEAVLQTFPSAVILRPSVMFGTEDGFFNRFAAMTRWGPILPLVGGKTLFQPVFVDDVAQAAVMAVEGETESGVYELGGPETRTLNALIEQVLDTINRRRLVINLPFWAGRIMGFALDITQKISLGIFKNTIVTRDQVKALRVDNVVSQDAKSFADLGIEPVALGAVLPGYLWRFRPSGQYDAIKQSAKNFGGN